MTDWDHGLMKAKLPRLIAEEHAGAHRIGCVQMAVRSLAPERDEATSRNDIARVNRGGGEGGDARRPEEAGPGGSQEIVEPD